MFQENYFCFYWFQPVTVLYQKLLTQSFLLHMHYNFFKCRKNSNKLSSTPVYHLEYWKFSSMYFIFFFSSRTSFSTFSNTKSKSYFVESWTNINTRIQVSSRTTLVIKRFFLQCFITGTSFIALIFAQIRNAGIVRTYGHANVPIPARTWLGVRFFRRYYWSVYRFS